MRVAHSLKGVAWIVGSDVGVRVVYIMEDRLVEVQDGRLPLQPEHVDALLQGCDLLSCIGILPADDIGWAGGVGREETDSLV